MVKEIKKILIANRGEIVCRIIKTAHKMGIKCVSIYSDADSRSLHVIRSDESVNIGPSPSIHSYLNIEKICEAAVSKGVQAVHPGYGFLSENPLFPEMLEKYGIDFIGPSIETIKIMADKITSKKVAEEAGVSVVPGYMGIIENADQALKIANDIGFPVMIKAAAGGGGKGMRIVNSPEEISQAFSSATNEAIKSFKDGRIFIEKFIEIPRHIEIQIIADKYGNIVCLGDRECSIQRYNQKVIEETPSPFLDNDTRQKMYEQSVSLAKSVEYFSAGTIEFIVDKNKKFYFLEMNTRLQVEHPVTELVTGIDIVEEMIRISRGEQLRFKQEDIKISGSSIEARIYAEDPEKNFLPSCGRISYYTEPSLRNNIRIDSGIYGGAEVSMFYDSMIAKIITYGENRIESISTMQKALNSFYIGGVSNNIDFLSSIFHHPDFISGNLHTGFISEHYPTGFRSDFITEECNKIFILTSLFIYLSNKQRNNVIKTKGNDVLSVFVNDQDNLIHASYEDNKLIAIYNHNVLTVKGKWLGHYKLLEISINDEEFYHIKVERKSTNYLLRYSGMKAVCAVYDTATAKLIPIVPKDIENTYLSDRVVSPISGMLIKLCISEGDEIQPGQPLAIIEAMKMENVISAEKKSKVKKIYLKEGNTVYAGDTIIILNNTN